MMNENLDVRMARVEEKIDAGTEKHTLIANDVAYIRGKLDDLTTRHWGLYAKVAGISAVMSLVMKLIKLGGN